MRKVALLVFLELQAFWTIGAIAQDFPPKVFTFYVSNPVYVRPFLSGRNVETRELWVDENGLVHLDGCPPLEFTFSAPYDLGSNTTLTISYLDQFGNTRFLPSSTFILFWDEARASGNPIKRFYTYRVFSSLTYFLQVYAAIRRPDVAAFALHSLCKLAELENYSPGGRLEHEEFLITNLIVRIASKEAPSDTWLCGDLYRQMEQILFLAHFFGLPCAQGDFFAVEWEKPDVFIQKLQKIKEMEEVWGLDLLNPPVLSAHKPIADEDLPMEALNLIHTLYNLLGDNPNPSLFKDKLIRLVRLHSIFGWNRPLAPTREKEDGAEDAQSLYDALTRREDRPWCEDSVLFNMYGGQLCFAVDVLRENLN